MFLLAMLMIIACILTLFTVLVISIGGTVGIIIFADVIVCIGVILWIIKRLIMKRKRK